MAMENIFEVFKKNYELALKNMELLQNQNEVMLKMFADMSHSMNQETEKNYREWSENVRMGFKDYQTLVLQGLEYLAAKVGKSNSND
ncbi:hypothetical protein DRQ26_06945 [bacterium]|nr:MAG: hypothetical protein DRQ26_06945 [bacterium]